MLVIVVAVVVGWLALSVAAAFAVGAVLGRCTTTRAALDAPPSAAAHVAEPEGAVGVARRTG